VEYFNGSVPNQNENEICWKEKEFELKENKENGGVRLLLLSTRFGTNKSPNSPLYYTACTPEKLL